MRDSSTDNPTIIQRVKDALIEDPAPVIFAAAAMIFATAKFIDSASMAKSRRISDKQTKHYFKISKKNQYQYNRVLEPPI